MIFYFSGTGNTRWAAHQVAEQLCDQLLYVPEIMDQETEYTLTDGEALGFIFPVHGWRPPLLIRRFIEQLQIKNVTKNTFIFALCTAGDSIGRTMEIFSSDLQIRGWHLNAAYTLIMPESYVGLPFMDVDSPKKEHRKKQQAAEDLKYYLTLLKQHTTTYPTSAEEINLHRGPIPCFFSGPVGAYFVKKLVTDKRFHVTTERCISCGKCESVCPVHDIEMRQEGDKKYPIWLHNDRCLTCFTCYHHCPTHAIDFGRQTQKKGQYVFSEE